MSDQPLSQITVPIADETTSPSTHTSPIPTTRLPTMTPGPETPISDSLDLSEDFFLALNLQIEHDRRKAEQEESQARHQVWDLPPARTGPGEPLRDDETVVESPFIAPFRIPLDDQLRPWRRQPAVNVLDSGAIGGRLDDGRGEERLGRWFGMGEGGMTSVMRKMAYVQLAAVAIIVVLPVVAVWRAAAARRRQRREGQEREMEERGHARDWHREG